MPKFISGLWRFIKRRWLLLLILLLIVGVVGFILYSRQKAQNKPLTYIKPEYRDLTKTLEVSGVVDADEKASLRFAAGGKLVYLGAKEGDTIKKGQVIATIDQRELQKRLAQDLNSYERQRLDFDQLVTDQKNAAPTQDDQLTTKKTQSELNDTVLSVQIRDIAIRDTRLISPFGGILVAAPTTTVGINILPTEAFEVVNPNTLVFKVAIDEADIALVKAGQSASITLDAYPDQPFEGLIGAIGYKSQQTSTSTVYIAKIPMTDQDIQRYRLGMSGDATITLATQQHALSVPIDVTRQRDNKTFVDVKSGENGKTEKEIETGLETDDYIEVTSGLTTDDEVVLPQPVETKK